MVTRHVNLYWELLHWLAIISLAVATAIAFATRVAGSAEIPYL